MHARTRLARIAVVLPLILATLGAPAHAGVTEKEFEEALALVERTLTAGKAKKAKELLLATLAENASQPWALYRLTEIKDGLRRCAFWSTHEKPDPKKHVSGELLSYSASSGQIKLRYAWKKRAGEDIKAVASLADFIQAGSLLVHPLVFEGPFTIEIEGSSYPSLGQDTQAPLALVCYDFDEHYVVSFGLPQLETATTIQWLPARIFHSDEGFAQTVDEKQTGVSARSPYTLKLVVGTGAITAYANGDRLLDAKKSPSTWGQFGFANMFGLSEVRITGKVAPTWIQGVVDAAVQKAWNEFEKQYRPEDDMPPDLRAKAASPAHEELEFEATFPGEDHPKRGEYWRAIDERLAGEKPESALDFVAEIPADEIPDALREWLTALVCRRLGREEEALQACAKVSASDPKFLPARRLRVGLDLEAATRAQAIASCRAVIDDFALEPAPRSDLVALLLLEGRPDEARAALHRAIDAGVPPGALEESDHLLARATKGPLWGRAFEFRSEHYVVTSDINQQLCFQAANVLEKFYDKFNIHLRRVAGKDKQSFRVYLFSGEAGYLAYAKDLTGHETKNSNGLYSPLVKQLLIWNLPDTDVMLRTVRHEGFHQYFDRLVGASPVWFNEGLAEYYEGSRLVEGKWKDGELNHTHLATLRGKGMLALESFLKIGPGGFYHEQLVAVSYAEAWAFVHFLLNGGSGPRRRFDTLLDALVAGSKPRDAVLRAFPDGELPALEKEFEEYLSSLR